MSAQGNLSPQQFMPVSELMRLPSAEAERRRSSPADLYTSKASEMGEGSPWGELDGHIRNGSIDPVWVSKEPSGEMTVVDGHHRIARAHQLGVSNLPVSHDADVRPHETEWDDKYPDRYERGH